MSAGGGSMSAGGGSMSHPSRFTLDALGLGQLSSSEAEAVTAHIAGCARCQALQAELTDHAQVFAATFKPAVLASEALDKAERPPQRLAWLWPEGLGPRALGLRAAGVSALAIAAVGLIVVVQPTPQTDDTRIKGGGDRVELFIVDAGAPRPVAEAGVPPGSQLRLRYDSGEYPHTRVLWQDETGTISALFPGPNAPATIRSGGRGPRWLPHEIELDDATETEHVKIVFCSEPFDHAEAMAALTGGRPGCAVVTREVKKTP